MDVVNIASYAIVAYTIFARIQPDALRVLLETLQPQLTMIFTNTKKMVDELVDELNLHDIKAIGLHGDMKQQVRTRVMDQFKQRNYEHAFCGKKFNTRSGGKVKRYNTFVA